MTKIWDAVIIGGGAAGLFCAGVAGQLGKKVLVLDHAPVLGEKIRISGGGRCNFTNIAPLEQFLKKIRPNGQFYRNAFNKFFNSLCSSGFWCVSIP